MWAAPMNCLDSRKLSCRRHQTFDLRTLTKAYQERLSALGVEYHNKLNKNNMMAGNIKSKYEPLQTWFVKYFHVKATSWIGFLQVCSISPAEQCFFLFYLADVKSTKKENTCSQLWHSFPAGGSSVQAAITFFVRGDIGFLHLQL